MIIGINVINVTSKVEVKDSEKIVDIPNPKNIDIGKTKNKNESRVELIFFILITSFDSCS